MLTISDSDSRPTVAEATAGVATDAVGGVSSADSVLVEDEVQAANSTIRATKASHQQPPVSGYDL